jgi:hypothetical protein
VSRPDAPMAESPVMARPWQEDLQLRGWRVAVALLSGMVTGALVGGVGGRLTMLVLRLTSSSSLYGTRTDDNFLIGRFSRSSLFLLALTAALGAVGGIFYLMARGWVPRRARPWAMGTLSCLVGGSLVVEPGRPDFSVLEPLWLAVVLFLALPGVYGVLVALVIEALLDRSSPAAERQWWAAALAVALLVLCGPPGIILLCLMLALFALQRRRPGMGRVWRSPYTIWTARVLLLGMGLLALMDVVSGVSQIL